jgi:hypothetical protein
MERGRVGVLTPPNYSTIAKLHRRRDVGTGKIPALVQQRQPRRGRESIGKSIAEIELGRMPTTSAIAFVSVGGYFGLLRVKRNNNDWQFREQFLDSPLNDSAPSHSDDR